MFEGYYLKLKASLFENILVKTCCVTDVSQKQKKPLLEPKHQTWHNHKDD